MEPSKQVSDGYLAKAISLREALRDLASAVEGREPSAQAEDAGSGSANSGLDHEILKPGNHLSLRVGSEVLSGMVDAVIPD